MNAELLSPAGNFQTALAAFAAGADAVYCGLTEFSARAFADNFTTDDLSNLLKVAHAKGKKVYVTFNTLVDEDDMENAVEQLSVLDALKPDAIIVQDVGIARLCRLYFPNLVLHASTQLVAHNLEGVLALKDLGFRRVVLARELSLEEIASIAKRCQIELEVFIHGALCYSVSGLCLFGAMEKGRSGNRGKCPYCCRQQYEDDSGHRRLSFSMKDLRLSEDVLRLVEAGVASLKIEGRMKSELYVASVTKHYRQILDGKGGLPIADLETVFSRRTTELYLKGQPAESVIDPDSLGHLGAEIGTVKRVTKDREGRSWLRFHTARALEKHDGLQFNNPEGGKPLGMGIVEMRSSISRHPVFEVSAGTDVEILLGELADVLKPGMKVYCSASQAVRRQFPLPGFRPSDYDGLETLDIVVTLSQGMIAVETQSGACASIDCDLSRAKNPDRTAMAVKKAFSKLGATDYRLGEVTVVDADRLFAPMSLLNDLRRDLLEKLDAARENRRHRKLSAALDDCNAAQCGGNATQQRLRTIKIRPDQKLPAGDWDEVIVAVDASVDVAALDNITSSSKAVRLALPVWTKESEFNKLRNLAKGLLRRGYRRWEASDLATLRLLNQLAVQDITADWSLYAFNLSALRQLASLGVRRFVASPENGRDNLQFLVESGFDVECLNQQSTPLFVSLTEPVGRPRELAVFKRNGLWVTTKPTPRTFQMPAGASARFDLSWDPS